MSIVNEPECYNGFKCIQDPPIDSSSDSSLQETTTQFSESVQVSKLKDSTTSYLPSIYSLIYCLGSACQCSTTLPLTALCNKTTFKNSVEYPVITDSVATHHMWNDVGHLQHSQKLLRVMYH